MRPWSSTWPASPVEGLRAARPAGVALASWQSRFQSGAFHVGPWFSTFLKHRGL
jgi:hypothetical protein